MPDFYISPVALEAIFSQLITVLLVLGTFLGGIWARGALDEGELPLTRKQTYATCLVGFVIMGIPLTEMVHQSLDAEDSRGLIVLLTACIPPFASGFTAREQIKKWLTSSKPPSAAPVAAE